MLRVIRSRKRATGSSATAGAGVAAPATRNALNIAISFFMVFSIVFASPCGCHGETHLAEDYSKK
ncbi:hypothetical protein [Mycoplana sp. MJR14]|uniref:hypothetical protein n=1 Tax=Mycoplana sp. MJR14 TaxID=3032583 RepID=UPI0013AEA7D8|nr:hypothetical protein [Mycoplana sp. MJR14]MDF1635159.1 hypothetical protein [Mycoplana sp. MJR14]